MKGRLFPLGCCPASPHAALHSHEQNVPPNTVSASGPGGERADELPHLLLPSFLVQAILPPASTPPSRPACLETHTDHASHWRGGHLLTPEQPHPSFAGLRTSPNLSPAVILSDVNTPRDDPFLSLLLSSSVSSVKTSFQPVSCHPWGMCCQWSSNSSGCQNPLGWGTARPQTMGPTSVFLAQ